MKALRSISSLSSLRVSPLRPLQPLSSSKRTFHVSRPFLSKELTKPQKKFSADNFREYKGIGLDSVLELLKKENAGELIVIDVSSKCSWTDYIVISSGQTKRHVKAIGETIARQVKDKIFNETGLRIPMNTDQDTEWLSLDLGHVLVNVFTPPAREFYDLETLWIMKHDLGPSDALEMEEIEERYVL